MFGIEARRERSHSDAIRSASAGLALLGVGESAMGSTTTSCRTRRATSVESSDLVEAFDEGHTI